jgi:hypothetical protein
MPQRVWRFACAFLLAVLGLLPMFGEAEAQAVPLPEHPRPDFERALWVNLNGPWAFRFDPHGIGERDGWPGLDLKAFPLTISVPFPWGSRLSGVGNEADVAWYAREFRIPEAWAGKRVFLCIGASDWETAAWIDGKPVGRHQGGYVPFELELTPHVAPGRSSRLVLRVDDAPRAFKLEGKQGYGNARGIWQTAYLEARPAVFLGRVHLVPDADARKVELRAALSAPAPPGASIELRFKTGGVPPARQAVPAGASEARLTVSVPDARLWTLEDPFLYEVEAVLSAGAVDRVSTYFGMRKVGALRLPGSGIPFVALNGKPVYLQMALDQSYHPDGFYTFPSDAFMRDEILRARRIGLNALRVHVKLELPRKLYWADRLGVLIMEDVPNSWGVPDADMRREAEAAMRGMIERDFNHPSIFSWVLFNETWGLQQKDEKRTYLPETQEWVLGMWRLAKQLDPTRLVEDNSPCNLDHVDTDIHTWHVYLPGYAWREHLDQVARDTFPGSTWNFIGGRTQRDQPLVNSECGNVWGYEGSAGDVDWSFDYHAMINELRRRPKIAGWLYTELHDVVNEWNGYFRFDRSEKSTGLEELVPGMSLRDLHAPFYVAPALDLVTEAEPGQTVKVPLWASLLAESAPARELTLRWKLSGWDSLGRRVEWAASQATLPFEPWSSREIAPIEVRMPERHALAVLALSLEAPGGAVLHRNFLAFRVGKGLAPRDETLAVDGARVRAVRFSPASFAKAEWSLGQWNVLDGLKVNGAGSGFFEYRLPWPAGLRPDDVAGASLLLEASAKQLFAKDRAHAPKIEGDFMRGKGTLEPSANPNAYPMTDEERFPSAVRARVGGVSAGLFDLPDDPADHRGLLSWHAQPRDKKLREAGSYGYLISAAVPPEALQRAFASGEIAVRLEVDAAHPGGLAVYGERFGRYPLDPTLLFVLRDGPGVSR